MLLRTPLGGFFFSKKRKGNTDVKPLVLRGFEVI